MGSGSTNNEKALEVRTHDIPIAEAMTDFMMQGWAPSPLTGRLLIHQFLIQKNK
jgi:Xaa-Pro aminopeptidase